MSTPQLPREEYIEQAYFFRVFRERLDDGTPSQLILSHIREEILSTTNLPMAIDFLFGEVQLNGSLSAGMEKLPHYFVPFQTFIMKKAEDDASKFDLRIALRILEREAEYRSSENVSPAALFLYQFECISRNRLGYDFSMLAIADDPVYTADWKQWILKIRFDLGTTDFADMVYLRSAQRVEEVRRRERNPDFEPSYAVLFDMQTGRIANANRGKDPLYMFAALQRQLGFPEVPRPAPQKSGSVFQTPVEQRFQRLEARLALLEQEQKGELDLSQFYKPEDIDP